MSDNAFHWINRCPVNSAEHFVIIYSLKSNLSQIVLSALYTTGPWWIAKVALSALRFVYYIALSALAVFHYLECIANRSCEGGPGRSIVSDTSSDTLSLRSTKRHSLSPIGTNSNAL